MTDWTLLSAPGVMELVDRVAGKYAKDYTGSLDVDDFKQEAYIAICTHPRQYQGYIDTEEWGAFAHALRQDLRDSARRDMSYGRNVESLDAILADK